MRPERVNAPTSSKSNHVQLQDAVQAGATGPAFAGDARGDRYAHARDAVHAARPSSRHPVAHGELQPAAARLSVAVLWVLRGFAARDARWLWHAVPKAANGTGRRDGHGYRPVRHGTILLHPLT